MFGKAPAPPKTAPVLTFLVERLLWWRWSRFEKYLAKQLLVLMSAHGATWSHEIPLHWKPEGAPNAAPCLEPLQNELFGRTPNADAIYARLPAPADDRHHTHGRIVRCLILQFIIFILRKEWKQDCTKSKRSGAFVRFHKCADKYSFLPLEVGTRQNHHSSCTVIRALMKSIFHSCRS